MEITQPQQSKTHTLVIISQDTPNLLNSLKCYWQIENMERTLSFRELRIDIKNEMDADDAEMTQGLKPEPVKQMAPDPGYVI